jgi:hypothetical protein
MIAMRLPELDRPECYSGLYVYELDGQTAVGYTAEEIAVLLESERYREGKVYRIHRALPDGTMELQGVARERFLAEEGLFFHRGDLESARRDFGALDRIIARSAPPCRIKVHLARLGGGPDGRETWLTALIYPAEYSPAVSRWLAAADYQGGDTVDGGISQVTGYYAQQAVLLDQRQAWPAESLSRPAEEVLATTHLPVQRKVAG